MNGLLNAFSTFRALPATRQWLFCGIFALVLSVSASLFIWLLSKDSVALFPGLTPEDTQEVASRLEQAHIPFSVEESGREIRVERAIAGKTRLTLLGEGLTLSRNPGFELFDKSDFGMTDYTQKINYQRALQGELERTIASLEEVAGVRVHIVVPETRLFEQAGMHRQAAVTLKLRKPLNREQINGIRALVAASVASLPIKNVVVLDQRGTPLVPNAGEEAFERHWQARRAFEHYLREKLTALLRAIYPDAPFNVQVDARLDFNAFTRERTTPEHHEPLEVRKRAQTMPGKSSKSPARTETSEETRFQSGSRTERFTRARGSIQRLNVSIALPDSITPADLAKLQRMMSVAAGIDKERGDTLSVEAIIHAPLKLREAPRPQIPTLREASTKTPSVSLALVCALLALMLGTATVTHCRHRRAMKKNRETLLIELNEWLTHHEP
ncbi:flagellar M-ring protein FliF [Legionella geestiana]|uniref:flagellar basal-body MS-ring/collar protein FliF n=1 Tax=Legionella geestiana TaxID=45065 RepID=UPI001091C17D|nr:flagellar basal-body MS-ring/collar protein FliF [Legionella geestiana]QDQ39636.1 flagellar M-ring protein FliF [Legionella geestiana]